MYPCILKSPLNSPPHKKSPISSKSIVVSYTSTLYPTPKIQQDTKTT